MGIRTMITLKSLAASAVFTVAGVEAASAASLNLLTGSATIGSNSASIDYLEIATDGDLSTFGAEVDFTDGVSPVGFTEIGFGIGFSIADPTSGATGGFDIFDDNGLFLDGDVLAVGFTDSVIEFEFGNLSGSGAGSFGSSVLALISFDDALGANPFASLVDGDFYSASISISNVTPIPLPAGFPLLAAGLGGLLILRRHKAA